MQNKLLPCPFCGGEAKIVKYCGTKIISYVECTNCLAYMGNQRIITSSLKGKEYFESEEQLINAWNTRKPMERIIERMEERRAVFDCRVCRHFDKGDGSECNEDCEDALIDDLFDIVKGGVDNAELK